jgi:hypothetical protein
MMNVEISFLTAMALKLWGIYMYMHMITLELFNR